MSQITAFEYGLWEWLYADERLLRTRRAQSPDDMLYAIIVEATGVDFDYAALDEVPGAYDGDHDGSFGMVDNPPGNLVDIDPRINIAIERMTH